MTPPNDSRLPWALGVMPEIRKRIGARSACLFLDLDGTLSPIAARPELAAIPDATRDVVTRLVRGHLVCFVSGRGLEDLRSKIGIVGAFYAANHGRQIVGPPGSDVALEVGVEYEEELSAAAAELEQRLRPVAGAVVEAKGLSLSVHYRLVASKDRPLVESAVAEVAGRFPSLRPTPGKMVYELRLPGSWDKGAAVLWLLERLGLPAKDVCPLCLGDDLTDEDMFMAVKGWGVGVMVGLPDRPTYADYWLQDSAESAIFLNTFAPDG